MTNLVWSLVGLLAVGIGLSLASAVHTRPARSGWAAPDEVDAITELGGRARACGIRVTDVERPSPQRLLLGLADGTALDLSLLRPRAVDPTTVVDLRWWEERGWVLRAETPGGVEQFVAWRCRLARP